MSIFKVLNNNFKYDIWGNYVMTRQLGPKYGYAFLAKKSIALAKAVIANKTIVFNNRTFYDTWN